MPATAIAPSPVSPSSVFAFDEYEIDTRLYELRRNGERVPVEPQVFDVLAHLVEHADRIVTKDELLDRVWPERYVTEAALNSRVMAARKALNDSGQEQRYIKTIHGRGYRFVGPVAHGGQPASHPMPPLRVVSSEGRSQDDEPLATATLAMPPVRYARTKDGVNIAYSVTGDGLPIVRVLGWFTHVGLEWRWDALRRFWDALGANHTLVRYDGRGMGLSQSADDFSLETRIADLEAVIEDAGLERFALLGMCEGVDTALHYALRHPERVTHLITYGGGADPSDEQWVSLWNSLVDMVSESWAHPSPVFRQLFAHVFLGPCADPQIVERFDQIQRESVSGERANRYLSSLDFRDVDAAAPHVNVPTLVIHRRNDPVVPFSHSQRLASMVPRARLVALEGEARWLMVDQSVIDEFVAVVDEFTGAARTAVAV